MTDQPSRLDLSKPFPLRVLLTVTTGRLLTKSKGGRDNGIGDLYELLGWMTNDSPFTHQLGRFAEECKPWLLRWFPELAAINESLPQLDRMVTERGGDTGVELWLANLLIAYPSVKESYDVPRIPRDDHTVKHPYDELVEMRGTDEGIVIVNPAEARND